MKRTGGLMFAVVVGAGLTLTGCGSDSGGGGGVTRRRQARSA